MIFKCYLLGPHRIEYPVQNQVYSKEHVDFQMLPVQSTWRPRLQGSAALWTFDHQRSYSAPSGCCRTQSEEGAG